MPSMLQVQLLEVHEGVWPSAGVGYVLGPVLAREHRMDVTPDEVVATMWDLYLQQHGVEAYVEARYSPLKTLLNREELEPRAA